MSFIKSLTAKKNLSVLNEFPLDERLLNRPFLALLGIDPLDVDDAKWYGVISWLEMGERNLWKKRKNIITATWH